MRIEKNADPPYNLTVVLSRRNLKTLLAKLDGSPPDSACTIYMFHGWRGTLFVKAEEDDVHYGKRANGPGKMHPVTESAIKEKQ